MDEYLSVEREAENEIVIERSRFITFVKRVETEADAKDFIATIRKKHGLATHNCYAYVVENGLIRRFSDDGEPSKTAGAPILEAITGNNLSNVVVVVTRYFGGIKLGAGGLVRAYIDSASTCIKKANVVKFVKCDVFAVRTDYQSQKLLNGALKEAGAVVLDTEYGESVTIKFYVGCDAVENLKTVLLKWFKMEIGLEKIGSEYLKAGS
ncbi:MAG: YigZ family protein [Christensenellaceae bacterium]